MTTAELPDSTDVARHEPSRPTKLHILGPMNSGSSFAEHLLGANGLALTDDGFRQTLFKHYPPALIADLIVRLGLDCSDVLFVVVARDPAVWIESMLRNRYELLLDDLDGPCRLDSAARNFHRSYHEHLTSVGLPHSLIEAHLTFDSIFEYWQASYKGYAELAQRMAVTTVRYEDLLADTARAVLGIRAGLGLPRPETVIIPMRPSKDHGDARSYIHARDKLDQLARDPATRPHAAAVAAHIGRVALERLGYAP